MKRSIDLILVPIGSRFGVEQKFEWNYFGIYAADSDLSHSA